MDLQRPRHVRDLIRKTFESLRPNHGRIVHEALLIRQGHYCGHRYQGEGVTAIWFLEEEQIKFYDGQGALLAVLKPQMALVEHNRQAA